MTEALIIYASLTGNTQACADIITEALEEHDIPVTQYEAMEADPEDLLDFDIVLIGSYTFGDDADIPDEMLDYYDIIPELDLTGKAFGTFGSGDTFYPKFATVVDDFERVFLEAGATQVAPGVKVDMYPDEEDEIEALETLGHALAKHFGK